MKVEIKGPGNEVTVYELEDDDIVSITVDGRELVGVIGGSGAGWWPTGDGGETNGDWVPLTPTA